MSRAGLSPERDRQVALVTGASSGIGAAAAEALARDGFVVVGTSRDASRAPVLDGVTMLDLDVSSASSVGNLVDQVLTRFGRIDVLVNNAGIGSTGAAEELSVEQTARVFDINVLGVVRMTKAVVPHMRARGSGRVLNLSSVLGFVPQPYMATYVASKHAIEGYSESVDHELREYGVRVLLIQPASTNTSFDASVERPAITLPEYADRLKTFEAIMQSMMREGDTPAVVAEVIVAAATDARPRLRYPVGRAASRVSLLRRMAPTRAFDKQIRKLNQMV